MTSVPIPKYNVEIFADFHIIDHIKLDGVKPIPSYFNYTIPRKPLSIFLTHEDSEGSKMSKVKRSFPNTLMINTSEFHGDNESQKDVVIQNLLSRLTDNPWGINFDQTLLTIEKENKKITLNTEEALLFECLGGTKRVKSIPINSLLNVQRALGPITIIEALRSLELKLQSISLFINLEPSACFIYGRQRKKSNF